MELTYQVTKLEFSRSAEPPHFVFATVSVHPSKMRPDTYGEDRFFEVRLRLTGLPPERASAAAAESRALEAVRALLNEPAAIAQLEAMGSR